jgi:death-on-curing protein
MKTASIIRLSLETVIQMHARLIAEIGGLDGIRDQNMLDMSVNSFFQTFGGMDLYPTLAGKATYLAFSLIKNHCFIDGNKRIGVTAMYTFLELNNVSLMFSDDELIDLDLGTADGSHDEIFIQDWINKHC